MYIYKRWTYPTNPNVDVNKLSPRYIYGGHFPRILERGGEGDRGGGEKDSTAAAAAAAGAAGAEPAVPSKEGGRKQARIITGTDPTPKELYPPLQPFRYVFILVLSFPPSLSPSLFTSSEDSKLHY